jgi:hypothetical protein
MPSSIAYTARAPETGGLAPAGRLLYAAAMAAYGVVVLLYAHSIAAVAPSWPMGLPGTPFTECAAGAFLILCGASIIANKGARLASTLLGILLLLWIVLRSIPLVVADPSSPTFPAGNLCEASAICGGAFLVAASLPSGALGRMEAYPGIVAAWEGLILLGRFLLGLAMIYFGYAHVHSARYVATLVPSWIPWHLFWAYFCGAALLAAGAGIVLKVKARWAATLSGVMIVLFGVLVNAPLAFAAVRDVNLWTSLFHTLSWSGGAFALAGTLKNGESPGQGTS